MQVENVLIKTHDFNHAKANAASNEKKTGNKTYVKHLGQNNSHPTINYQDYLVVEILNIEG